MQNRFYPRGRQHAHDVFVQQRGFQFRLDLVFLKFYDFLFDVHQSNGDEHVQ